MSWSPWRSSIATTNTTQSNIVERSLGETKSVPICFCFCCNLILLSVTLLPFGLLVVTADRE